jgi:hypothetical protein
VLRRAFDALQATHLTLESLNWMPSWIMIGLIDQQ